jgi:hydrogenase nickel incorporation protein HypA/HybF
MHERSLVQSLLCQVSRLVREHRGAHVSVIRVSMGEFAGVEPELFRLAYDDLVGDTPLCGAELVVDKVPLEARCEACGEEFVVEAFRFKCPSCHSPDTVVVRGEGLILESVTMEGCDP